MDAVGQPCFRTNTGERSDVGAGTDDRILDDAHRLDFAAFTDLCIFQYAVGADGDAVAQHYVALQHHPDVDDDVAPGRKGAAQIEAFGVAQGHACQHQRLRLTPLQRPLQRGELGAIVDTADLFHRRRGDAADRNAVGHRHGDDVGKVVLTLGIIVVEPRQPIAQPRGGDRQQAGVAFADRALLLVGVLLFDDAADAAAGIAHDAAIAGGIVQRHGDEGESVGSGGSEVAQRLGADQRHVAVEHQHRAAVIHAGQRLRHRMAGAELALLQHPGDVQIRQPLPHLFGAMAVHHVDMPRRQFARDVVHAA